MQWKDSAKIICEENEVMLGGDLQSFFRFVDHDQFMAFTALHAEFGPNTSPAVGLSLIKVGKPELAKNMTYMLARTTSVEQYENEIERNETFLF